MRNAVGTRARIGVVIPSTNTVVEHDYSMMRPSGVTFHYARSFVVEPDLRSESGVQDFIDALGKANENAMREVLTCRPDYLTMGMSGETFWGGAEGSSAFEDHVREVTGLRVTTGASAVRAALQAYGARTLAFVSPYPPMVDEHLVRYFADHGYRTTAHRGLACPSATAIAQVTEDELVPVLRELDDSGSDVIVQVGTNLSMVRLADAAERFLRKPVIAINAACVWHTLRELGIEDRYDGFGSLLRDH